MSKPDVSSEPSMEDILASIRRIIAEDPPGSRPDLASTSAPVLSTPNMARPTQAAPTSARVPSTPAVLLPEFEPSLPRGGAPLAPPDASGRSEPSFARLGAYSSPSAVPDTRLTSGNPARIEPTLPDLPIAPSVAKTEAPPVAQIDAQILDILGEAAPLPQATTMAGGMSASNLRLTDAEVPAAPPPRPGFTVSRVGYLAETAPKPLVQPADPFDFDLGPSPFERTNLGSDTTITSPAASTAAATPVSAENFAREIDALIADVSSGVVSAAANVPSEQQATLVVEASLSNDQSVSLANLEVDGLSDAPTARDESESRESLTVTDAVVLAGEPEPETAAPAESAEPVLVDVPKEARVSERQRDILPLAPVPQSGAGAATSSHADVSGSQLLDRQRASSTAGIGSDSPSAPAVAYYVPAATSTDLATASQTASPSPEDALAELLRPMLRTWLAENMPKIVERALRQELNQIGNDQKTAAE